jgi:hypothetical protein
MWNFDFRMYGLFFGIGCFFATTNQDAGFRLMQFFLQQGHFSTFSFLLIFFCALRMLSCTVGKDRYPRYLKTVSKNLANSFLFAATPLLGLWHGLSILELVCSPLGEMIGYTFVIVVVSMALVSPTYMLGYTITVIDKMAAKREIEAWRVNTIQLIGAFVAVASIAFPLSAIFPV